MNHTNRLVQLTPDPITRHTVASSLELAPALTSGGKCRSITGSARRRHGASTIPLAARAGAGRLSPCGASTCASRTVTAEHLRYLSGRGSCPACLATSSLPSRVHPHNSLCDQGSCARRDSCRPRRPTPGYDHTRQRTRACDPLLVGGGGQFRRQPPNPARPTNAPVSALEEGAEPTDGCNTGAEVLLAEAVEAPELLPGCKLCAERVCSIDIDRAQFGRGVPIRGHRLQHLADTHAVRGAGPTARGAHRPLGRSGARHEPASRGRIPSISIVRRRLIGSLCRGSR